MDPIHSTVSSDAWWVPSSIQFVLLLDHYPPCFFSGLSGWIHQATFFWTDLYTLQIIFLENKGNLRCGLLRKTAFSGIWGVITWQYLKRYSQYASSWIKATWVLGWPSWWVSDSKKRLTLDICDQWECQDPKVDPKEKPYFAENIPWNLAQKYKPCSYLPLKNTGTWNGHWWNILEPASRLTRQRQTRLDHLDPPCDSSILLSPKSSLATPIAKNRRMFFFFTIQLQADFNANRWSSHFMGWSSKSPLGVTVSEYPIWKKPGFHKHAIVKQLR